MIIFCSQTLDLYSKSVIYKTAKIDMEPERLMVCTGKLIELKLESSGFIIVGTRHVCQWSAIQRYLEQSSPEKRVRPRLTSFPYKPAPFLFYGN